MNIYSAHAACIQAEEQKIEEEDVVEAHSSNVEEELEIAEKFIELAQANLCVVTGLLSCKMGTQDFLTKHAML